MLRSSNKRMLMHITTYYYNSEHKMKWTDADLPSLVNHAWHETAILKQARPSVLFSPDEPNLMTNHSPYMGVFLSFFLSPHFILESIVSPIEDAENYFASSTILLNILTLSLDKAVWKLNITSKETSFQNSHSAIILSIHTQAVLGNRMTQKGMFE